MRHHKARRTALLALATVFLAVAWVWDGFIAVGRLFASLIPWTRFKQAFVDLVDWLPTPIVLLIFLVPLAIVEPLLAVATVAIAKGYVVAGVIAWIFLKVFGLGLIAVVFDLTKHKILRVRWFAWCYEKVSAFNHYAHRMVAPYTHAAAALMRLWRGQAAEAARRLPGAAQLAARFAARKRAAQGRTSATFRG